MGVWTALSLSSSPHFRVSQVSNHQSLKNMKKETLKNIINFIVTVLTAIASAFCVQSCKG